MFSNISIKSSIFENLNSIVKTALYVKQRQILFQQIFFLLLYQNYSMWGLLPCETGQESIIYDFILSTIHDSFKHTEF